MLELGNTYDIVPGILPLDLQTARNGDYVSLKGWKSVDIVFFKGAGTAADDPTLTLRQATAVAGTSVKDLAVITTVYKKQGTLTGVGTWTKVTQTAAATFVGDGTSAEEEGLYVIHVEADELDVDNGFDCIVANIGDTGTNAQLGAVLYVLNGPRYGAAPESLVSSIAD